MLLTKNERNCPVLLPLERGVGDVIIFFFPLSLHGRAQMRFSPPREFPNFSKAED